MKKEARLKYHYERQVSQVNRVAEVRRSCERKLDDEGQDLSPSQRAKYVEEEVWQYEKPEIIRRAVKNVRDHAS